MHPQHDPPGRVVPVLPSTRRLIPRAVWSLWCHCGLTVPVQTQVGARAKFILRKLASSIVPASNMDRVEFIHRRLGLPDTPVAENKWTKGDCVRAGCRGALKFKLKAREGGGMVGGARCC
jgi:hypothetical protein